MHHWGALYMRDGDVPEAGMVPVPDHRELPKPSRYLGVCMSCVKVGRVQRNQ